ncbi:histidinol-phosphatase HisJ family protein [Butyrivibrio sp. YAB3001]|uniref:histidinol-phosphatase HisJ family protein n=1 Tax=Butyrivibrio sp. YAB3001 TaxID=1520812 RepID=UPI0008F684E0|nr:histidinol-phosphatase HisJ family protein [Butyrivibrio sp. YAB3001]SFB75991.1 histidinol-phosphatase (PHP family) [Butyrivibrio sp. YAB3001]
MTTKLPADYHLHTHHSGDSSAPMKDMIESAISHGLGEICFTEHMDMDFPVFKDVPKDTFTLIVPPYHDEVSFYQNEYKDKINIKYGVELGLQPQIKDINRKFINDNDFDFVIGSIHLVDKKDPYYYPDYWEKENEDQVIARYFELTIECLQDFDDFDVLGHLDYIVRYTPSKGANYSYDKYKELIDEILRIIIKKGKGLDFNSKALFYGGSPNPNPDILRRYKELGGEIITFGSDAHVPEGIAGAFDKMRDIALSCGFDHYYTYEKKTPSAVLL